MAANTSPAIKRIWRVQQRHSHILLLGNRRESKTNKLSHVRVARQAFEQIFVDRVINSRTLPRILDAKSEFDVANADEVVNNP